MSSWFGLAWPHLLTVFGFALGLFFVARMLAESRPPGSKMAWLLAMLLVPYVGVPAYLLFGGRKLRRLREQKRLTELGRVSEHLAPTGRERSAVEELLQRSGEPPVRADGHAYLLKDGHDAWDEMMRLIREARHSIHIQTFILGRDPVGRMLIEALAERARDGVQVYLLVDALGSWMAGTRFVAPLRKAGGHVARFLQVIPFRRRENATLRNHRKLFLVDGRVAIVGGMNLAHEYMGPDANPRRWEDTAVRFEGLAVEDCYDVFASDWLFATGERLPELPPGTRRDATGEPTPGSGTAELQIVASGPDVPDDPLYNALLSAVSTARERIWILTPYFIPDEVLYRLLALQGRLGRDVRIIIPARSNHLIADLAGGQFIRRLLRHNVQVFHYEGRMLHSKLAVIDDGLAIAGSANIDVRSLHLNYELTLLLHSRHEVREIASWIADHAQRSRRLTSPASGFLRRTAENFASLLSPLL